MRGQQHAPAALYPRERPGIHCTRGWVGPRSSLDRCEKSRHPTTIRSPDRPARSQSLYRLHYLAHLERVLQFKCWHLVMHFLKWWLLIVRCQGWTDQHITHLRQQCHISKCVIFQERLLKVLKCYNFLWVQRWHNCSSAASFANRVMTLCLLKTHLPTFLFIPITQKC